MNIIHYTECPACRDQRISEVFTATDFTVSKQSFSIWSCKGCSLLFTQDVPDQEDEREGGQVAWRGRDAGCHVALRHEWDGLF